ncbi:hypothetical protein [Pseudomonas lini]|uniref:hypothetical protein n=1 Tax=Pseudomonas lini TaxID=163011 RepID=UPI000680416B|nr:hypothetical protein [Pseudomonas lini]KNH48192.1 hypothetical protein ACS73_01295 [Pseudomonas lini]
MKLGLRASPTEITFTILDGEKNSIVAIDEIKVPKALSTPEILKYVRFNILDVIREYSITKAGIRVTESNSQTLSIERIQIEGVIQEAFASSLLESYYVGQISSISKRLGIARATFKPFIDGTTDFDQVEGWDELTKVQRESVFCAIGA